jgi:hypothetical protein
MKITRRQLRRIIREVSLSPNRTHHQAQALEDLLNSWLYDKVTLEYVKGQTYLIRGVDASSMIEVKEEIRDFDGASFEYELGSGNKRDVGVRIG